MNNSKDYRLINYILLILMLAELVFFVIRDYHIYQSMWHWIPVAATLVM